VGVDSEIFTQVVAIAVSFGVGVPILARSAARRDRAGVLLALSVVLDGVEWSCWALSIHTPANGTPLGDALAVACRVGVSASVFCLLLFTRLAFRPAERWAGALVAALGLAMLAGLLGSGSLGDWGGFRNDNAWIWLENAAQLGVYLWACAEPARYNAKLRRRWRLGLADPVVVNRILLWACYGGVFAISQLVWMAVVAVSESLTALDPLLVALGVAGQGALWLAFLPPLPYRRWLASARPDPA
jgi:hypothetical protein